MGCSRRIPTGPVSDRAFSAALLAGGRSTRMGTDKAFLPFGDPPRALWERQLDLLASLGPDEILLSQNGEQQFPGRAGVEIVVDEQPDGGPLGGLVSCLRKVSSPRLLVLAVDLPFMTGEFLGKLLRGAGGAILRDPESGRFEPVAAVYPAGILALAERRMQSGEYSLQGLIAEGVEAGDLEVRELGEGQGALLRNLNRPEDLDGSLSRGGG